MLKASIIIPTYCPTKERYELCEKSFAEIHQTGLERREYELILINNGGIPDHQELIGNLDVDVSIAEPENIGNAKGINEGLHYATGSVIALMDDDLSYKPGWLKKGLELLETQEKVLVSLREIGKIKYVVGTTREGNFLARKVGGCWIVRRSVLDTFGNFPSVYGFDGVYARRFLRAGYVFLVSKEPYIKHLGEGKSIIYGKIKNYNQWYERQNLSHHFGS